MELALRVATELVNAQIAYHETRLAEKNNPCKETFDAHTTAFEYYIQVQRELDTQCLLLARGTV